MDSIFCSIGNDEDYEQRLEIFNQLIKEQHSNNSKKPETVKLLQCINDIVISQDYQPKTKYYAILIAKDCFLKKYSVFVSSLSSSALLQNMTKMAKTIDPKKEMNQKGLNLFPDREIGNKLMTLILQCIVKWSQKYPSIKQSGQPTKYKIFYNQLVDQGVVLPSKFIHFPNFNLITSIPQAPQKRGREESQKRSISDKNNLKDINKNLRLSLNKIQGFLSFLKECQDRDQAQRQIVRYHKKFQQENRQYQQITNTVIDQELLDSQGVSLLFLMTSFYNSQNDLFRLYLENDNDLKSYINQILLSSELLSAKLADTNPPPPEPQSPKKLSTQIKRVDSVNGPVKFANQIDVKGDGTQKNQIKPKVYSSYNRPESVSQDTILNHLADVNPQYKGYGMDYVPPSYSDERYSPRNQPILKSYERDNIQKNMSKNSNKNVTPKPEINRKAYQKNSKLEDQAEQGAMMIKEIFRREHRPKSSFIQLRRDLQKQRTFKSNHASLKTKTTRKGRDANISRQRSKLFSVDEVADSGKFGAGYSKVSIYKLHPKVTQDQYSGRQIKSEVDYSYQLEQINLNQSLDRFKICALRQKHLLFQNEVFQIGFNTEQVYRQHPKYPSLLNLTLFIGNITDHNATQVSISFEGDKTNAVYASPLKIPKLIDGRMQIKQNLLVVPLAYPFNLLNFKLKYRHKNNLYRINVFLPYMINKFCKHEKVEIQEFNKQYQALKDSQIRTKVFNLSKKFPPALLTKYISNSIQISSYKQFIRQQKYVDYQLGFKINLLNKCKYLMKITIRPDMTAVIQAVAIRNNDDDKVENTQKLSQVLLSTIQFIFSNNEKNPQYD